MMASLDNLYVSIGEITKPRGLRGEVKVLIYDVFYVEYLYNLKSFFFEEDGLMVPYFITRITQGSGCFIYITIDSIYNRDGALAIVNKHVFIKKDMLANHSANLAASIYNLKNFLIIDEALGEIGMIEDIIKYPQQNLASLIYNGRSILIPLIDEFIVDVDYDCGSIKMNIPSGLLDV